MAVVKESPNHKLVEFNPVNYVFLISTTLRCVFSMYAIQTNDCIVKLQIMCH